MRAIVLLVALLCFVSSPSLAATGPVFTIKPAVSTNVVGGYIELGLYQEDGGATGPYGFQWHRNGLPLDEGERVTGTQGPTLRIENAQLTDAGAYMLQFTNVVGTNVLRQNPGAVVYVVDQPAFVNSIQTEVRNSDVTLSILATGGLLSYQWFWQDSLIPGATNQTLRFTNAYANANSGYYSVRVSNPANPEGIWAGTSVLVSKPAPGGTYEGLFSDPAGVELESAGFARFTVSAKRSSYTGKLTMGTGVYSFSGAFGPDHYSETTVNRRNDSPLTLRLQLLTMNDYPQITGQVESESWTASLKAHRIHFSSKVLAAPFAGKYTLAFVNTNRFEALPQGDSYGSITVKSNGTVVFTGKSADAITMSQSSGLSRLGDWPFYKSMYRGRGMAMGWLKIARQTGGSISGPGIGWIKAPGPDASYPDGYALLLQPLGSTYAPAPAPLLNYTNGAITLYGPSLFHGDTPMYIMARTVLTSPASIRVEESPEGISLGTRGQSGEIYGRFTDPTTGRRVSLQGVVLQQQGTARGYFLSEQKSGGFILAPSPR